MRTKFRTCLIAIAFGTLAITATPIFAHSDKPHSEASPVVKEQKPWGIAGDKHPNLRVIQVSMDDNMRFSPDRIDVKEGETIRIAVRNVGQVMHEFVIGTKSANEEHAALMMKFPKMDHDEPYMAHVRPGKSEEIIWTFNKAGEFEFACLISGHYQAGMVGKIMVAATREKDHVQHKH